MKIGDTIRSYFPGSKDYYVEGRITSISKNVVVLEEAVAMTPEGLLEPEPYWVHLDENSNVKVIGNL